MLTAQSKSEHHGWRERKEWRQFHSGVDFNQSNIVQLLLLLWLHTLVMATHGGRALWVSACCYALEELIARARRNVCV